ncbi:hypothetical protein [Streptomyces microflavus]|uniref:hypothetical protein n=1 Tax=Streptomyces microflavus TaxID=1919 RepID=UPI003674C1A5
MATLTLGAAVVASAAAPVVRFMPLVGTLQDNFNDNTVDTAVRWPRSYGSISETGGRARVPCTTGYAAYASARAYTLGNSYFGCRLYPAAAGGAATEAWSQVLITTSTGGTDAVIEVNAATGVLAMAVRAGYSDAGYATIPYDPVAHAWVRIRAAAGQLMWETSPTGVAWTVRRTATAPGWVATHALGVQLIAHRDSGTADFAEYDNFNLFPKTIPVGAAMETSAAGSLSVSRSAVVGAPHVVDRAWSLGVGRTRAIGSAGAGEQAQPIAAARTVSLGVALEFSGGQAVGSARTSQLSAAYGTDAAQAIQLVKTLVLGPAISGAAASEVSTARRAHLGPALVAEGAGQLRTAGAVPVGAAAVGDVGLALVAAKTRSITAAAASDKAQQVFPSRAVQLGPAAAATSVQPLRSRRTVRLGAAACSEYGRQSQIGIRVPIGAAHAVDGGARVRQPWQIRIVRTARCLVRGSGVTAVRQRPADVLTPSATGPHLTPSDAGPALTAFSSGPVLTASSTTGG